MDQPPHPLPPCPGPLSASGRFARALECGLAFFALPALLYVVRHRLAFRILLLVLALAAACAAWLLADATFDRSRLWSCRSLRRHLMAVFGCFAPLAVLVALATATAEPDRFLVLPLANPIRWLLIMVLYPILAAAPQELIFRVFFFHRYGPLFSSSASLIAVNTLSFGLGHLLYGNWVAVALTTAGGALFAYRYAQSGSLLVVSIEHGLWGDFLFTIGAGWYLYSGAIR